MNGRRSASVSSFHSVPSRFEISELCIFGFSCAIFRLCPLDQTMKAFIGRFTLPPSPPFDPGCFCPPAGGALIPVPVPLDGALLPPPLPAPPTPLPTRSSDP